MLINLMLNVMSAGGGGGAYFPFVNGRCHLKRSMPFFSSELHSLGLRTQKVAVTGSCVSLVK